MERRLVVLVALCLTGGASSCFGQGKLNSPVAEGVDPKAAQQYDLEHRNRNKINTLGAIDPYDFKIQMPIDPTSTPPGKNSGVKDAKWTPPDKVKASALSVSAGSSVFQDCTQATRKVQPDPYVIKPLEAGGTLNAEALQYFKACFLRFDQITDATLKTAVRQQFGLLQGPNGRCTVNFLSPTRAITARHCVAHPATASIPVVQLHDAMVVGYDQGGANWSKKGVDVYFDGANAVRVDGKRSGYTFARDFVVLAPVGAPWPTDAVDNKTMWSDIQSAVSMTTFAFTTGTWVKSKDIDPQAKTDWMLMLDRMPTCTIGFVSPLSFAALHRCQGVPGTSGSALVYFAPTSEGPPAPRIAVMHIGRGSEIGIADGAWANSAISVPVKELTQLSGW